MLQSHFSCSSPDVVTCSNGNYTAQVSNEKPPNIKLFDPKTPAFWIVLEFELAALGFLILLGVAWTVIRTFRKHRKVSPPLGRSTTLPIVSFRLC